MWRLLVLVLAALSNTAIVALSSLVKTGTILNQARSTTSSTSLHGVTSESAKVGEEDVSICIIGGGVSGLVAAQTAAKLQSIDGSNGDNTKIILLEASPTFGGRVQSDRTEDGFVLDRGFAVFIEEYPFSKQLLNYDSLQLRKFQPGALIKLANEPKLARVSDPLRRPGDTLTALVAPVGSLLDKIKTVPLLYNVFTKTIDELFDEPETDTLTCLKERWKFSDEMIGKFFQPFLEGIYLSPLDEQSSRMFHFVMKMFSEGAATLPASGMQTVTDQLVDKAISAGVELCTDQAVSALTIIDKDANNKGDSHASSRFIVSCANGRSIRADSIIVATDGNVAQRLVSTMDGYEDLNALPEQLQRSVGCLYYSFKTSELAPPVSDPILVLNGVLARHPLEHPINNICFPSVVSDGYTPDGYGLCSVTVLKKAMDAHKYNDENGAPLLDKAVRNELASWFPDLSDDIRDPSKWVLKGMYQIPNAQPAQLNVPFPASVHGRRADCTVFRGKALPKGLYACGDYMATATLNGALESGVYAGEAAAAAIGTTATTQNSR